MHIVLCIPGAHFTPKLILIGLCSWLNTEQKHTFRALQKIIKMKKSNYRNEIIVGDICTYLYTLI